ncbi:MAG TPA: hypothetical protein VG077_00690 [Verrucomicrobiae bacterium]|nr:hypothetical protein [Verrucomicrobiae bacterium]
MIATMEALKLKIAVGIKDLDHGRFQIYNDVNLMQLADEIGQCGRIRLHAHVVLSRFLSKAWTKK